MLFSKLSNIVKPIIQEFPIILIFFILIRYPIYGLKEENIKDIISFISVWVFYAYFIGLTIYLCKKPWLRWLWYIFLFSVFGLGSFLYSNFNMQIDPSVFMLIGDTNKSESQEFAREYMLSHNSILTYSKVLAYIVLAVCLEIVYRHYILTKIKIGKINIIFIVALSVCLCYGAYSSRAYFDYIHLFLNKDDVDYDQGHYPAFDWYSRFLYSPCIFLASKGHFKKAIRSSLAIKQVKLLEEHDDSLDIVLVIGESYIKSHAHLYGHYLETTPILSNESRKGNLYTFNNAITPFNLTQTAIRNMMSCNSYSHSEKWFNYPYFPLLFKKAGYNVYFWDNQYKWGVGEICTFSLNEYIHDEKLSQATYTKNNSVSFEYDSQLIDDFKKQVNLGKSNNLIIFHLLGQHFKTNQRFPQTKQFVHFTTDSIKRNETWLNEEKLQLIADYENATYYNDHILGEIIDMFRNRNTVLVYLSDHGDEVFDYRDHIGRTFDNIDKQKLTYQYDIPFIIWCSDKYKHNNREAIAAIEAATNKPIISDNICQLFFHLGGIQTEFYHEDRDFLSPNYKCVRRLIGDRAIDYDSIK